MLKRAESIMGLSKENLIRCLDPRYFTRKLSGEEIIYLAKAFDACWEYDYRAAAKGKIGRHAVLKFGSHSDIFFNSKIFLANDDIREIIARQLVSQYYSGLLAERPDWVLGIPDGAKDLGKDVARILKSRPAVMTKENGQMKLESRIGAYESVLMVEDLCTRGTGLKEAVREVLTKQPRALVLWHELAVVDRGGLGHVNISDVHEFTVVSLAQLRANDWPPDDCPLCHAGSKPIKPKVTDENWQLLIRSQL